MIINDTSCCSQGSSDVLRPCLGSSLFTPGEHPDEASSASHRLYLHISSDHPLFSTTPAAFISPHMLHQHKGRVIIVSLLAPALFTPTFPLRDHGNAGSSGRAQNVLNGCFHSQTTAEAQWRVPQERIISNAWWIMKRVKEQQQHLRQTLWKRPYEASEAKNKPAGWYL